jgi:hypothetical protein
LINKDGKVVKVEDSDGENVVEVERGKNNDDVDNVDIFIIKKFK